MTKFLYILIILLLVRCETKKDNDWANENLNGRVKSITIFNYKAINRLGNLEKGETSFPVKSIRRYNYKGNRIDETEYKIYGDVDNRLTYKYNNKGKRIETIGYNNGKDLYHKSNYIYDDKGNQIEEISSSYFDDGVILQNKITYKYSFFESFRGNGNPIKFGFYEPDFNGNQIETKMYLEDGRLSRKFTYEYNRKGYLTKQNFYEADGSLSSWRTYKYDDKGNLIEEKAHKPDGNLEYSWIYKYDFDNKGNWIKKTAYGDVIPSYISERKIEYY